jgi:hypothetical protein
MTKEARVFPFGSGYYGRVSSSPAAEAKDALLSAKTAGDGSLPPQNAPTRFWADRDQRWSLAYVAAWLLVCCVVFRVLCWGDMQHGTFSQTEGESPRVRAATGVPGADQDAILIQGRYRHGRTPCIPMNGARVWFKIDSFEIEKVVRGELRASGIDVRCDSPRGPHYPENLCDGEVYLLRLTPTAETKRQLKEMRPSAGSIWVDAIELVHEQ